mmetsp:Transcript_43982/g.116286  ORF Transcript_43982/g.116286 Transcript_43982/m.116286 type:complete len:272 (+) Transcript_43982:385-1200(+)
MANEVSTTARSGAPGRDKRKQEEMTFSIKRHRVGLPPPTLALPRPKGSSGWPQPLAERSKPQITESALRCGYGSELPDTAAQCNSNPTRYDKAAHVACASSTLPTASSGDSHVRSACRAPPAAAEASGRREAAIVASSSSHTASQLTARRAAAPPSRAAASSAWPRTPRASLAAWVHVIFPPRAPCCTSQSDKLRLAGACAFIATFCVSWSGISSTKSESMETSANPQVETSPGGVPMTFVTSYLGTGPGSAVLVTCTTGDPAFASLSMAA